MKSLLAGFLVGTTAGCLGSWWQEQHQPQAASATNCWSNQLKTITAQLKQDVIPTVKDIQKTLVTNQAAIKENVNQIMVTAEELKQKLPLK